MPRTRVIAPRTLACLLLATSVSSGRYPLRTVHAEAGTLPFVHTGQTIALSLRSSIVPTGSEFEGFLSLPGRAPEDLPVLLSSSNAHAVRIQGEHLTLYKGQSEILFRYYGVRPGTATLTASTKSFGSASSTVTTEDLPAPSTLRAAAALRGLLIGAAALAGESGSADPLKAEPAYAATLGGQYDMLEPETAMKWSALRPSAMEYDFAAADELVAFAQSHDMQVRGHTLVWCVANPSWLDSYVHAQPAEVARLLHDHIQTVMSRYKGKIFAWDVVNEALDDHSSASDIQLQHCLWYDRPGIGQTGTQPIEQAFRWAREADPGALLFYNENDVLTKNGKFEALYAMLQDFVRRGVPIDGVGLQMHLGINGYPDSEELAGNVRRITELGLQVHITEMDVAVPIGAESDAGAEDLRSQAATYRRITKVCLENPGCKALQTWGFSDKHSWVTASHPGMGAALPFDSSYAPKSAATEMLHLLYRGDAPSQGAHRVSSKKLVEPRL